MSYNYFEQLYTILNTEHWDYCNCNSLRGYAKKTKKLPNTKIIYEHIMYFNLAG